MKTDLYLCRISVLFGLKHNELRSWPSSYAVAVFIRMRWEKMIQSITMCWWHVVMNTSGFVQILESLSRTWNVLGNFFFWKWAMEKFWIFLVGWWPASTLERSTVSVFIILYLYRTLNKWQFLQQITTILRGHRFDSCQGTCFFQVSFPVR